MIAQPTPLPGMSPPPSAMETAANETIAHLHSLGLIHAEHAALVQLVRELARTIAVGSAYAKTSVPHAAQQLLAALDALPKPIVPESPDPLTLAVRGAGKGDTSEGDPA